MNLNSVLSFIVIHFVWTGEHTDSIECSIFKFILRVIKIQSLAYHERVAVPSSLQRYYTIVTNDNAR